MSSVTKKESILKRLHVANKSEAFTKLLDLKNKNLIKEAYVFGSFAENNFHADSDIDLLFVIEDSALINHPFIERPLLFSDIHDKGVSVDLLVYSVSEFHKIKAEEKKVGFWKSVFKTIVKVF